MKKSKAIGFLDKNLSKGLALVGFVGIFVTTYFAVEGTFKAVDDIQEAKRRKEEETGSSKLEPKEVVKACAKDYVKTGVAMATTVASWTCAYSEEARKATEAVFAYRTVAEALGVNTGFQQKLMEALGPKKSRQIEEEYANEKAREMRTNVTPETAKKCDGDKVFLFKDIVQGREFYSTGNAVKEAFLRFREEAINDVATDSFLYMDPDKTNYTKPLNDLNAELGIEFSEMGHTMSYTYEQIMNLRPRIGSDLDSNGEPCFSLWYDVPMAFA